MQVLNGRYMPIPFCLVNYGRMLSFSSDSPKIHSFVCSTTKMTNSLIFHLWRLQIFIYPLFFYRLYFWGQHVLRTQHQQARI